MASTWHSRTTLVALLLAVACGGNVESTGAGPEPEAVAGTGGSAVITPDAGSGGSSPGGSGGTAGTATDAGSTGGSGGSTLDAAPPPPPVEEPDCPDAASPEPIFECDLFAAQPGGCGVGQACYPGTVYGADECDPGTFISYCAVAGSKEQGDDCNGTTECGADFVCVGLPFRCARRCYPGEPCPDGLICEGVVGFDDLGVCE